MIVYRFSLREVLLLVQAKYPTTQPQIIARTKKILSFCIPPTNIFWCRSESECFVAIRATTAY